MKLYTDAEIQKKVKQLSELFPIMGWPDLFELTPQIMEIVEAVGIVKKATGSEKEEAVMSILNGVLTKAKVQKDGVEIAIPLLIKALAKASKGKYAINKEQNL